MSLRTFLLTLVVVLVSSGCISKELDYTKNRYKPVKSKNADHITTEYVAPPTETIIDTYRVQRATMRPYVVFGVNYTPVMVKEGDVSEGIASWYGPNFHAKSTSNGETYNMYAYTAAHKTMPMNTMVKVTNLENGKFVIVRVNDRGPFVEGRIIDLSNAAARDIEMVAKGTASVRLEVIGVSSAAKEYANSIENSIESAPKPKSTPVTIPETSVNASYTEITKLAPSDMEKNPAYIGVQIGAYKEKEAANGVAAKFSHPSKKAVVVEKKNENQTIYKVYVKSFATYEEAKGFIETTNIDGFVIKE